MIMMYGTLFMMAGAYTLAKNGHVRGDVLYGFFQPRTQATIDLIALHRVLPARRLRAHLRRLFLRRRIAGRSTSTRTSPRRARRSIQFKTVIPLAGAILLAAGHRRDHPLRRSASSRATGPRARRTCEEVDVDKLKEMVHVKDEDIQKLDELVVQEERASEDAQGALVRLRPDGDHRDHHGRRLHALGPPHQRPPRPADAGADRGGDHARLPDRVHADGHGRVLRLARLPQREPGRSPSGRCSTCWCSAPTA